MASATLELADGEVLLAVDDLALEVFSRGYDRSFRVPCAWAAVKVKPKRHDRVEVTVGRTGASGGSAYGEGLDLDWAYITFEVSTTEEAPLRAFVRAAAARAGRSA